MSALLTFPSEHSMGLALLNAPAFMRPSPVPYAVSLEGALSHDECDLIQDRLAYLEPYTVPGCGAVTRECHGDALLNPIETVARNINSRYFGFDLDEGQHSWLQTYEAGGDYHRHMDGTPGQTRKLTAVAILSSPLSYEGGRLKMYVDPRHFTVPKTRGTIVVFQHWVEHDVSPITVGTRQTINMGFWGPPFK